MHRNTVPDRMIDDLVAFARDWRPDLAVWDTMTFAGPVAARACGAAHARLMFGLDLVACSASAVWPCSAGGRPSCGTIRWRSGWGRSWGGTG
ncbi:hypothetical protein ACFVVA_31480 [Kitasatospora sp. NPDC058048]|uniref:hypothetical protein n=1 Tax=Kitasatospora sp. NPDC058048 TaxID=3346313 RepID=UPI0036DA6646